MATARQMEKRRIEDVDPFRQRLNALGDRLGEEGRLYDARMVKNAVRALLASDDLVESLRQRIFILEQMVEANLK